MHKLTEKQTSWIMSPIWVIAFLFVGCVSCEDKEFIELKKEKIKIEIKQLHDTTAFDVYKYPSGATGSLRFDWETGEKGKLIE